MPTGASRVPRPAGAQGEYSTGVRGGPYEIKMGNKEGQVMQSPVSEGREGRALTLFKPGV